MDAYLITDSLLPLQDKRNKIISNKYVVITSYLCIINQVFQCGD